MLRTCLQFIIGLPSHWGPKIRHKPRQGQANQGKKGQVKQKSSHHNVAVKRKQFGDQPKVGIKHTFCSSVYLNYEIFQHLLLFKNCKFIVLTTSMKDKG